MTWNQVYDPLNNQVLSTTVAAIPIVLLLLMIASNKVKTYWAAAIALILTIAVAVYVFTMPMEMAVKSAALGAVDGFCKIGWIILNVLFLYRLTVEKGLFAVFQHSLGRITNDRRLQILLICFCFGAFFEGAAGFGTPVAVCAAMMMGLGFSPLTSAAMALFANTATVAFGAIGAPIIGLSASSGIDTMTLGKAIGIQSMPFTLLMPLFMLWVFCGWKKTMAVWPAVLVPRWSKTIYAVRYALITITLMLSLATLTGSSGLQGTLGLAFAATGPLFPFFSAVLGWLGVAATGSDTSANVLFGGLQVVAANKAGFNPVLMAAANSTGGCMGKIIAISSLVIAVAATGWTGSEGKILRFVFPYAVFWGVMVGVMVMLQAYVFPWSVPPMPM